MSNILKNKFEDRIEQYNITTLEIIKLFSNRLDQAMQIFSKDERKLSWFFIDVIEDIPEFVYIKGSFRPNLGEMITTGNQIIKITEELLNTYPAIITTLMLPMDILENGDALQIASQIKMFYEICDSVNFQELITIIKNNKLTSFDAILNNDEILGDITKPKFFEGFNVSTLSESEIRQISHFLELHKTIRNN